MATDNRYPLPSLEDVLHDGSGSILLAMDFDGVVNSPRPRWPDKPQKKHVRTPIGEYLITWAPGLRNELKALSKHPSLQLVWLTSWGPEIGIIEALMGLPTFPRAIETLIPSNAVPAVKHAVIAEIQASGRPYIWCDDEEAEQSTESGKHADRLEIRPKPKHGLTPGDLERIWAFVTDVAATKL